MSNPISGTMSELPRRFNDANNCPIVQINRLNENKLRKKGNKNRKRRKRKEKKEINIYMLCINIE